MDVDNEDNAWELSKENVQPLKTGRRMGDLKKALSSNPHALQQEAQQYELQLRNTTDPHEKLDVWCNYIAWREQHSPHKKCFWFLLYKYTFLTFY